MGFFDALLGRTRPVKSSLDELFGLSTAELTLETEFNLTTTGGAALCFRPISTGQFAQLEREINELLGASTKDAPLTWSTFTDSFGYDWFVLKTPDFSNAVATVHMISSELQESGFADQLLTSVFQFRDGPGKIMYWMYNYKRGSFYPFAPLPNQSRDNAFELRLSTIMGKELKIESDLTKWYALWGIPLEG